MNGNLLDFKQKHNRIHQWHFKERRAEQALCFPFSIYYLINFLLSTGERIESKPHVYCLKIGALPHVKVSMHSQAAFIGISIFLCSYVKYPNPWTHLYPSERYYNGCMHIYASILKYASTAENEIWRLWSPVLMCVGWVIVPVHGRVQGMTYCKMEDGL